MNDKIIINHFGPLKQVELELNDIMVFIGPQASGKSTIAKLIHFLKFLTSKQGASSYDNKKAFSLFNQFFGEHDLSNNPNMEIEYLFQPDSKITINHHSIHYNPFPKLDYKTILIPAGRAVYSLISDSLFSLTSEAVSIDPLILNFGQHIELSRKRLKNQLTENPALEIWLQEILKGHFKYVNGENRIYFEQDKYITLDRASSGQQEVLPLLLILMDIVHSSQIHFVTIEEPEAHLYPYSQYKLIQLISYIHNVHPHKHHFIITTHSPYILTAFNNLQFAHQVANRSEDAKLSVTKVIPQTTWLNSEKLSAYYVSEGGIASIVDESTGLIADNEIDDASEEIAGQFDELLTIYRKFKHGNG